MKEPQGRKHAEFNDGSWKDTTICDAAAVDPKDGFYATVNKPASQLAPAP